MARLVQLFLEAIELSGDSTEDGSSLQARLPAVLAAQPTEETVVVIPTREAINRGIWHMENLLSSEEAVEAGMAVDDLAGTFIVIAMSLDKKPGFKDACVMLYEAAMERHEERGWERCALLKQLGIANMKREHLREAADYLLESASTSEQLQGNPRDMILFGGVFSSKETRREFALSTQKLLVKVHHDMGDDQKARAHMTEVRRLTAVSSGDLVEKNASRDTTTAASTVKATGAQMSAASLPSTLQDLWSRAPDEDVNVTRYSFADEGPTVLLILDLNEHLGIGAAASAAVQDLSQFRVRCDPDAVDVQLRLRQDGNRCLHFHFRLCPLAREIIPEDTVPKLRGRSDRRRLELKLFKRDKDRIWHGDSVVRGSVTRSKTGGGTANMAKGTALNPLSAEEIAALPKPSCASNVPAAACQFGYPAVGDLDVMD